MPDFFLLSSCGNDLVDALLREVVGCFERRFPGRVRGYYLTGSYAEGVALPVSDVDLCVLFRGRLVDVEEEAARRLVEECAQGSPVELDVEPLGEPIPYPLRAVSVKLGSRLIYGEDSRDRMPLPPRDAYVRHAMDLTVRLLARLRDPGEALQFPLGYPDPEGEFYGYDRTQQLSVGGVASRSTKDLLTALGLAGTAILAYRAGRYAAGKRDSIRQYRAAFEDGWGEFLQAAYAQCRDEWQYGIPADAESRRRLRLLCERALAFENHFLGIYRGYLRSELDRQGLNG